MPIGTFRLFAAVASAFLIGIFLYLAFLKGWFTPLRQLYLIYGVSAGLISGHLEARIVIPKLSKESEAFTWKVTVIATAVIGVPLLLIYLFFGSELLPFGLYGFLCSIPVINASSGWYFRKFEKENKVNAYGSYFSFKYWVEPNPDKSERLYHFVCDVRTKEASLLWRNIGFTKILFEQLEKKRDLDSLAREEILKVLNPMKKLTDVIFPLFMSFIAFIIVFVLIDVYFIFISPNLKILNILVPVGGFTVLCFFTIILGTQLIFKKKMAKVLETINAEKLASVT